MVRTLRCCVLGKHAVCSFFVYLALNATLILTLCRAVRQRCQQYRRMRHERSRYHHRDLPPFPCTNHRAVMSGPLRYRIYAFPKGCLARSPRRELCYGDFPFTIPSADSERLPTFKRAGRPRERSESMSVDGEGKRPPDTTGVRSEIRVGQALPSESVNRLMSLRDFVSLEVLAVSSRLKYGCHLLVMQKAQDIGPYMLVRVSTGMVTDANLVSFYDFFPGCLVGVELVRDTTTRKENLHLET